MEWVIKPRSTPGEGPGIGCDKAPSCSGNCHLCIIHF